MARISTKTYQGRSKQPITCRRCHRTVNKGEQYYSFAFFRGPVQTFCAEHYPKPSETTANEVKVTAYSAIEHFQFRWQSIEDFEDFESVLDDLYTSAEEAREQAQEKYDNLESAFPNGNPTMENIQEQIDALESWISNIETAKDELDTIKGEWEEAQTQATDDAPADITEFIVRVRDLDDGGLTDCGI